MSLRFSSWFSSSCMGCNCFRLSAMLISGRVVTKKRIHCGSLKNWLAITSSSSLRPWYSVSSSPSITIRIFLPGSSTLFRGSLKSNANSSSTPMLLSSTGPRFLDSCSTRDFLYSGRVWLRWEAKDWSISWGFLLRTLLCWQKWLPESLPAFSILLHITAERTDFPIPAFPLITITRFGDILSPSQCSTLLKIHSRVPSWNRSEWYSMSPLTSALARFLSSSSALPVSSFALKFSTSCLTSWRPTCSVSCSPSTACPILVWVWDTLSNFDMLSCSVFLFFRWVWSASFTAWWVSVSIWQTSSSLE